MAEWLPRGYSATSETDVQRSRFIATLARTDTEDEARALVARVRRTYPDARHHCSAFIIDVPDSNPIERSSDDGEPAGTAGTPMLDVLRGAGIANATVVVTRYFGGTLLGTGGLVHAYSAAVKDALARAPRVTPVVRRLFTLTIDHATAGRVQSDLVSQGVDILGSSYGEHVTVTLATDDAEALERRVAQVTRGSASLTPAGTRILEVSAS